MRAPSEEGVEPLASSRRAVLGERDRILAALKLENVLIWDFPDPGIEARVRRMNPVENAIQEFRPAISKQPVLDIDDDCKQGPQGDLQSRPSTP